MYFKTYMLFCFISDIFDAKSDLIPMRNIIVFFLIICSITTVAQKKNCSKVTAITKVEFDEHLPVVNLITKPKTQYKVKGVIQFKTANKTIILKDDGEMKQYVYEGDLDGLTVIHELEPNTEEYYLIDKQTGKIDTLFERPIFYTNRKDFICLEGAGTDVHQRIEIGCIENGRLAKNRYINLPESVIPEEVYWFDKHTLYIVDNMRRFYKLML